MPTPTFTTGNDQYVVTAAGTYVLDFLAGDDTLNIDGGTHIYASMDDGNDVVRVRGAAGIYQVTGGIGADRFELHSGNGTIDGGANNDLFNIYSGSGYTINGGSNADMFDLFADTSGAFRGGPGADQFFGNGHTVTGTINAGDGDDFISRFVGTTVYGGTGEDTYRVDPAGITTIVEYAGEGVGDTVQVPRGMDYTLPNYVEFLIAGDYPGSSAAAATLTGNSLSNSMYGSSNDETFSGRQGADLISGGDGADTLNGGAGDDWLIGEDGADTLNGSDGNDILDGNAGSDTLNGETGDDTMTGSFGNDQYFVDSSGDQIVENFDEGTDTVTVLGLSLFDMPFDVENGTIVGSLGHSYELNGTNSANILTGGNGNDVINGLAGDDTLIGGIGADTLSASYGEDTLLGGNGNDFLWGSVDSDTMTGGNGSDVFHYFDGESTPAAPDQITDFVSHDGDVAGDDTLNLFPIDADTTVDGDQAFNFNGLNPGAHQLWYSVVQNGNGTSDWIFYGDTNGDTTPEYEVHIHLMGSVFYLDDIDF